MYERSYGHKYADQRGKSTAEIARMIRADIKQAVGEGLLPERWTYSVRSDNFTGGSSIDVEVRDCADAWQVCDGSVPGRPGFACHNVWCSARNDPAYAHAAESHDVLTEEAEAAKMTLKRVHGAYNHDGSESQVNYFDVNYYGHVEFEDARSAEFRAREKESAAARRAETAQAAQAVTRKVLHRGRESNHVHLATEVNGKVRLLCGARPSRFSLGSAPDDADVTCSRCAKKVA